ncbi:hypothetical protein Hanom_Chr02g00121051 [Helianthus anomalus]
MLEEPFSLLVSRKRSRKTTAADVKVAQKIGEVLVIGKLSKLRTLYKFSPEAKKKTPEKGVVFKDPQEPAQKRTKVTIKPFKTARLEAEKKKAAEKPVDKVVEKEKERERQGRLLKSLLVMILRRPGPLLLLRMRKRRVRRSSISRGLTDPFMSRRKKPF